MKRRDRFNDKAGRALTRSANSRHWASALNSDAFRLSRWTIGFKLIAILSSIILVSLFGMIQLVTYFFKDDYALNIQERNIKLAEVIGINIENTVTSLIQNGHIIADSYLRHPEDRRFLEQNVFENSPHLLYLSVVRLREAGEADAMVRLYDSLFQQRNGLSLSDVESHLLSYQLQLRRSQRGAVALLNASPGFPVPVVVLAAPYRSQETGDAVLIACYRMALFLNLFQTQSSGLVETFMVAEDGSVITHPDAAITLAGANFINLSIVRTMVASRFKNGQTSYRDPRSGKEYLGSFWKVGIANVGVICSVPVKETFLPLYNIQRRNIYLMLVMVCLALFVGFIYSRQLTRPLKKLTEAAGRIEQGDYSMRLRPEHRDEIGLLSNSFNSMSRGLQERENLKDSFGRFVNREIAERSLSGRLKLGGVQKEVAVLFCDIRNFTASSEKMPPKEVLDHLNRYFTDMVQCIDQEKGVVDKFIGDAIMAHWGALGHRRGNHAEQAINAALKMRVALKRYNERYRRGEAPVVMGCGINAGPVIAGQIGSAERLEYTVIGDTVNVASRAESLSKIFLTDIIATAAAMKGLSNVFDALELKKVHVKGKSEPLQVYAVLGRKDDPNRPASIRELRKSYFQLDQAARKEAQKQSEREAKKAAKRMAAMASQDKLG